MIYAMIDVNALMREPLTYPQHNLGRSVSAVTMSPPLFCTFYIFSTTAVLLSSFHPWTTLTEACSCTSEGKWEDETFNRTDPGQWVSRVLILGKWTNISGSTPTNDECFKCPIHIMCYAVEHIQVFRQPMRDGQQLRIARRGRIETSSSGSNCGFPQLEVGREFLLVGGTPEIEMEKKECEKNTTGDAMTVDRLFMSLCRQYWEEKGMAWRDVPESLKKRLEARVTDSHD